MNVLFPFGERWDVDLSSLFYHSTTISQHIFTYGDSSREPDTLEKLTFFGKNLNDLYFT